MFAWSAIETVKLPSTLKRLEAQTFSLCINLKSIDIPNSIEYIGEECFEGSGVKEITFPSTLKEIGEDVFKYCSLKIIWLEEDCTLDIK